MGIPRSNRNFSGVNAVNGIGLIWTTGYLQVATGGGPSLQISDLYYFFFTPRVLSTCDLENGRGDLQPIQHLLDKKEHVRSLQALLGLVHISAPHNRGDTRNAIPVIFAERLERTLVLMLLEVPIFRIL